MPKKLEYKDVKEYIEKNGCKLLSKKYKNTTTPLKIQCSCGTIFEKTMKIIRHKGLCMCNPCVWKYQGKNLAVSYDEVKRRYESEGYILHTKKSDYKKASYKCTVECPNGHLYEQTPSDFFMGHKCKKCAYEKNGLKSRKPYEEVKKYIESFGYELLTKKKDFAGSGKSIAIKCPKGHTYNPTFDNFRGGSRCPKCYEDRRGKWGIVSFEKRVEYVESFGYKVVTPKDKYKNSLQTILIKCDKGHIYETSIKKFIDGYRCSVCSISRGELKIKKFLDDYKIDYVQQHKFSGCKFKRKLPFDFYLPKYNACIEFDGRQHYDIIKKFGGLEGFVDIKIRDSIKNNYCIKNGIRLIRIPHWELKNIENILNSEFKKYEIIRKTFND